MLIPSIDLMGGKIVQLVQGQNKALEFDDFDPWVERFSRYPLVQVIDLDAAMQQGDNRDVVRRLALHLTCQVGGGIRTIEAAQDVLAAGAQRVIIGSALVKSGQVDMHLAAEFSRTIASEALVFALDSRAGKVAIRGWQDTTGISTGDMMKALEPWCGGFLYTHIDTEGLMQGIPLEVVAALRRTTSKRLIVAGGIATREEIDRLHAMNVDAVVGMALYLGRIHAWPAFL